MVAGAGAPPAALARPAYVPGRVVVGYARPSSGATAEVDRRLGVRAAATPAALPSAAVRTMRVPRGETVTSAISRLRHRPGVAYAVPDYIAHAAAAWIPDDRGRGQIARGWEAVQWNFLPTTGIDAPDAWANLIADGHPGARGVTVAVLDSGVAYRNWRSFHRSPDFAGTRFVDPYDFVAGNAYPLDREDHGTFVTGTIAEATNNGIGLTGLAYGASIMPVRVLDRYGDGDAVTIAKGIRYAVEHHAQVINLSLEFDLGIGGGQLPELASALRYAHDHGVVVVAAAGNDSGSSIAYPASAPTVISVGATTRDRCLADYSNTSSHLDLVAPGGGDDANLIGDPNCHPNVSLPGVYQMMFPASDPSRFGLYSLYGTSMAAPDVSSAAAMVIASGVIGRHPSPAQVLARLEQTALQLGKTKPNPDYGYGLLDLAAATAPSPASTP
jgi:serine protease